MAILTPDLLKRIWQLQIPLDKNSLNFFIILFQTYSITLFFKPQNFEICLERNTKNITRKFLIPTKVQFANILFKKQKQ